MEKRVKMNVLEYRMAAPSVHQLSNSELLDEELSYFLPAYCSNLEDIKSKHLDIRDNVSGLNHCQTNYLKDFRGHFQKDGIDHWKVLLKTCKPDNTNDPSVRKKIYRKFKLLTPNQTPPLKELFKPLNNGNVDSLNKTLKCNDAQEIRGTSTSSSKELTNKGSLDYSIKKENEKRSKKNLFSDSSLSVSLSNIENDSTNAGSVDVSVILENSSNDANVTMKQEFANSLFRKHFILQSPLNASSSQLITGPSLDSSYGFKLASQDLKQAKAVQLHDYLTIFCLECFVLTRPKFVPDPSKDPIAAIFLTINQDVPDNHPTPKELKGIIVVGDNDCDSLHYSGESFITYVNCEESLLNEVVTLVHHWDPDILVGYEVQKFSWGYLLERSTTLNVNLISQLSRIPDGTNSYFDRDKDEYGADHTHEIHIRGRIILNVWRLMRAEVSLQSYTLENCAFHVLHVRIPSFSFDSLTKWWRDGLQKWKTIDHLVLKCDLTVQLLNNLDLISRTSELARLFGIPFYDVLARGTQFRVESMMLRLSRAQNMIAISPSIHQRAKMKSPEWLALTMEPESKYYTHPVVVLDFQSLYPSIMIAYNYCYSTCLGRVDSLGENSEPFILGTSYLKVDPSYLTSIIDQINFSPCGVAFVQPSVRKGILSTMLEEILQTRIMVKTSMKKNKEDASLKKILHSRQLGLKLIANVTYGYTSANFSGRMPCSEVGDSVVSKGRETLERAISLVNNSSKWRAKVVYGDTDSLFVHLPGRTKDQAFRIGQEMADEITLMNPKPIKLRFEKVYLPCILQTKKRYVGYMYETVNQEKPIFDAKGIETVRRDACPAVAKILQKSLTILFNTSDVSLCKQFVQRQFIKILRGSSSFQDLIFAKEYRGSSGYRPTACVPALELARQWAKVDKRKEPAKGERVPYVIVYGAPGLPLIKLVRSPEMLFSHSSLKINVVYYITRAIIPPLQRCFSLVGIDVHNWFTELPRANNVEPPIELAQGSSIAHYFVSTLCPSCGSTKPSCDDHTLCSECLLCPQRAVLSLSCKVQNYERALDQIRKICRACIGHPLSSVECISLDCPITYRHHQVVDRTRDIPRIREILKEI